MILVLKRFIVVGYVIERNDCIFELFWNCSEGERWEI